MPDNTPPPNNTNTPANPPPANTPPGGADELQKTIDRLMQENSTLRSENSSTKTKLSALEQSVKDMQNQGHKTAGEWETVAKNLEKDRDEWKTKYESLNTTVIDDKKLNKLTEEVVKLGILPQALSDVASLDFKEMAVAVDSNGRFLVTGAELAAKNLKAARPHWFTTANPPPFNAGGGGGGTPPPAGGSKTVDQAKAEYQAALRSGDQKQISSTLVAYNNALKESRKKPA